MNLRRFYSNPEVKRITTRFTIMLFIGIICIYFLSCSIVNNINKNLINQNTIIAAQILKNTSPKEIIKNFYTVESDEEVEKARTFLKTYGYDENLSIESNEISSSFLKEIIEVFIPTFVIYIISLYLIFLRELKGIFFQVEAVVKETGAMSDGEYTRLEGKFNDGDMSDLISSLNYMGDRVNNSIERLKEEKRYLKDFLSDMSHQLKTPLASLIMFNDLLKENESMPYEDRVNFLDRCEEQLGRMEWLIMNLLKVGRLEAGVVNFNIKNQSVKETIELAISSLRGEVYSKQQDLIICGDLEAEIKHDRQWLAEAISNIVKNAIEHTPEKGTITIEVLNGKLIAKINIKDNGSGISEDIRDKIFKRFYKGENSTNPKSIGIGLSLAKSIIEDHGGEIKLINEEEQGTCFQIVFLNN
ncbi:sensor histidine kinase [Clostridium saccharoperbutylacetonicum]|uniref:sensor histidine kinase n=1 Tax=Clostridium saccharoperbutylacetonicum TaxID=36745 RepID=UPI00098392A5|nr:HAMP domain-containing sensor histidine kinase [Clostridium saccharoperbutylacetonicum]AQR96060.1 sensor histidine kinase MtrB [Clostridium saccharoperbutylacetonicum]NSB31929.1 signal transduction histidine kinase [Clostridium saccharoperbutylacetonicum]